MKKFLLCSRLGLFVLLIGPGFLFLPMSAIAFQATAQQAGAKACEEKPWHPDSDGDGFGAEGSAPLMACEQPSGYVENDFDCDDNNAAVNPPAREILRDGLDNDCDGVTDDNPNSPGAPMFEQEEVYLEAFVGETSTFTIKALDPQPGDLVTIQFEKAIISGTTTQEYYGHMDGVTFSPSLPLTSPDAAVTTMTWHVQEDQLAIVEMHFTATDQHGNKSLPLVITSWTDYRLVTHPLPPLTIGINQPFEAYITTEHNQELNEEGAWLANAPDWLQAKVVQVPDPGFFNTIRIWGTPPAGSEGNFTPTLNFRELFGQEGVLEFQLTVTDCQNQVWYADRDGDGFGGASVTACEQPAGFITSSDDCNDENAAINPYAEEKIRDGIDNNCNGETDETPDGTGAPVFNFVDAGFSAYVGEPVSFTIKAVDPQIGDVVTLSFDSVSISSGENGYAYHLEGASFSPSLPLSATDSATTLMTWIPNENQRGFIELHFSATDQQGNTTHAIIYPFVDYRLVINPLPPLTIGIAEPFVAYLTSTRQMELAEEVKLENAPDWLQAEVVQDPDPGYLNSIKIWGTPPENSKGTFSPTVYFSGIMGQDSSLEFQLTVADCHNSMWYADRDEDGFGGASTTACEQPAGFITTGGDCNDEHPAIYPGAPEILGDELDNDCDGRVDVFPGTPVLTISNVFFDIVAGEAISIELLATDPDAGDRVVLRLDSVYSWTREEIMHDFEGVSFSPALPYTATDTVKAVMHYAAQQDHYGENIFYFSASDQDGNTTQRTIWARVHPILKLKPLPAIVIGAERSFEAIIQIEDPEFHFSIEAWLENAPAWLQVERKYDPQISQGYYLRLWGTPPAGSWGTYKPIVHVSSYLSEEQSQYDSQTLQIRVGNCFGYTWYADADGDGFGAAENRIMVTSCYQPAGFVSTTGDCNDEDPGIYPGATELMDGVDNNCNGEVDEEGSCYASQVVSFRQGYRPDGKPIGWERSRPAFALDAPQENDYFNFVSLGFGGELVLELGSLVYDDGTEAPDMMVVETTWGWAWRHCYEGELAGNPETMVMEVSANGNDWVNVPGSFCRNAKIDLSTVVGEGKLPYVRYVKITDTSNPADFPGHANGYDVDGIITCPELFEERQTNARIAGAYDPNFFNKAQEEEEVMQEVKFYPNPVKNKLTIQTGTTEKLEVKVYSLQGSLVYTGQHQAEAASGEIKLNLGTLSQGVYLIHLQGPQLQEFLKITKE